MNTVEIILLGAGLIAFVVSFFIQDKKEDIVDGVSISEDEIRQLVNEEYERTRTQLDDITEETINYSMEKAERQLERITNEKIMAMGEYSDTILNQINTNHQETVFLHDMLNQNKNDLTVMLSQAMKDASTATETASQALQNARKASESAEDALSRSTDAVDKSLVAEENMISARKAIDGNVPEKPAAKSKNITKDQDTFIAGLEVITDDKKTPKKPGRKKKKAEDENPYTQLSLQFDTEGGNDSDNNEKILRLHNMGKSNVAIAKELGLGVGEVNLVINLFKK